MGELIKKRRPHYLVIITIVLAVIPLLVSLGEPFMMHILVMVIIYSILAVSLNLFMGYTGQVNLAHAAFFGIGAYGSALLAINTGMSFWSSIFIGGLISAGIAALIGYPILRLRGIYFAMISFAFLSLVNMIFIHAKGLTGGSLGLFGIPHPSVMGMVITPADRFAWVYIALGFLLLTIFVVDRVVNSRVGKAFIAIREDEDLARSTGVNTMQYKVLSLALSSFFAGIAGGLYGGYMGIVSPVDFGMTPSLMMIAMCVIGGLGTTIGPVIGCAIVQLLPEALRAFPSAYYLIFGILVVVLIIKAPSGVMGGIKSVWAWYTARAKSREGDQV